MTGDQAHYQMWQHYYIDKCHLCQNYFISLGLIHAYVSTDLLCKLVLPLI